MRFFSKHFICYFYFLRPKILHIVFIVKTMRCSNLFSSFHWFYFWLCVFHSLYFGRIFLTIHFKHFDFIALCCLNLNSLERSSIWDFFVDSSVCYLIDCLMCLYISFNVLLILKFGASVVLDLINVQSSSSSISIRLFDSYSGSLSMWLNSWSCISILKSGK